MQSHTPVNGKTMAACTSGIVAAREQDILALQRKLANKTYNPQKTDTTTHTHTHNTDMLREPMGSAHVYLLVCTNCI